MRGTGYKKCCKELFWVQIFRLSMYGDAMIQHVSSRFDMLMYFADVDLVRPSILY